MAKEPTEKERFTILMEAMESKFNLVLEKVQDSDKKNEERFQELSEEITPKINIIEKAVAATNKKLEFVQRDISEIKSEFPLVKNVLSDHEHRIKKLEAIR